MVLLSNSNGVHLIFLQLFLQMLPSVPSPRTTNATKRPRAENLKIADTTPHLHRIMDKCYGYGEKRLPSYTEELSSYTKEPPPYTLYPRNSRTSCSPDITERLRKFLSFCLAVDYELHTRTPDQITLDDFCHFAGLARRCDKAFPSSRGHIMSYVGNVVSDDPIITEHLLKPAQALGIPNQAVLSMLRIFVGSIGPLRVVFFGGYHSYVNHLRRVFGLRTLARKLVFDRKELFKAVLPAEDTDLLHRMIAASLRQQHRFFEELDEVTLAWKLTLKGRGVLRREEEYRGGKNGMDFQTRCTIYQDAWIDCRFACLLGAIGKFAEVVRRFRSR
ncbi:uncharacterized protein RHO25_007275 [Cercospora beticola]|uniref:Uncharacterized protein n=1 Tax=Cercospora beticola TaxID=122368 RepID=A0ABZ0NSX7_CERBT|nr:hypothetical protein RHO25_007275 [Cercospora beticola]CAK1358693.1 unnamed protein product [Cercospora beticola]